MQQLVSPLDAIGLVHPACAHFVVDVPYSFVNTASVASVFCSAAGISAGFSAGGSVAGAAVFSNGSAVGFGSFSDIPHAVRLKRRHIAKTKIRIFSFSLPHFHGIGSTECD